MGTSTPVLVRASKYAPRIRTYVAPSKSDGKQSKRVIHQKSFCYSYRQQNQERERTPAFNVCSPGLSIPRLPSCLSFRCWRNQSITAGVIFPAADATAQLFDKSKGGDESSASEGASWDFPRTLRWLFFGFAVQAPWNHVSRRLFFDRHK